MIHAYNQILMRKQKLLVNHVDEEFVGQEEWNSEEDDGEHAGNEAETLIVARNRMVRGKSGGKSRGKARGKGKNGGGKGNTRQGQRCTKCGGARNIGARSLEFLEFL